VLSKSHVLRALADKQGAFGAYEQHANDEAQRYRALLRRYEQLSPAEVYQALGGVACPGALPTAERQPGVAVARPFGQRWRDHRQARAWARDILAGVTTIAVDGSQITPDPSFSIPLGAIQIGWFENPHDAAGRYVKDILFELVTPDDLAALTGNPRSFPEQTVALLRFERECAQLQELMFRAADEAKRAGGEALALLDGSFIISFAAQVAPELRQRYARAARAVLHCSAITRVPVIGYVDSSYASDLTNLLRHLASEREPAQLSDARLLASELRWGDRTEWWVCAREDALASEPELTGHYRDVCFCYLRATSSLPPARVEAPRWLVEQGGAERVLDLLRAECVVGLGYPYAIETADALAVITTQDRDRFYGLVQQHLEGQGVRLHYARKAASKRVRR
jgi:hypothetical protein